MPEQTKVSRGKAHTEALKYHVQKTKEIMTLCCIKKIM